MDEKTILETSGFVSSPYPGGSGGRSSRRSGAVIGGREKRKRISCSAKYFLVRLGICAAVFAAVLSLKLLKNDKAIAVIGELTDNKGTDETEGESRLGRLRFVDLPSIAAVFAPSKGALLPVEARGFDPDADGGVRLAAPEGTDMAAPFDGKVSAVGIDDGLGRYVSITTGGDMEFVLYGLGTVAVEKGQPVSRGQRLGSLGGGALSVRVYSEGRPVDAAEVFGLGKAS